MTCRVNDNQYLYEAGRGICSKFQVAARCCFVFYFGEIRSWVFRLSEPLGLFWLAMLPPPLNWDMTNLRHWRSYLPRPEVEQKLEKRWDELWDVRTISMKTRQKWWFFPFKIINCYILVPFAAGPYIYIFPLEFCVIFLNSSGWCSSSKSENLLFLFTAFLEQSLVGGSYIFVIFIPNVGEVIQFDLRIFFKMGCNPTTNQIVKSCSRAKSRTATKRQIHTPKVHRSLISWFFV